MSTEEYELYKPIWQAKRQIADDRHNKNREVMAQYDEEVYLPAMRANMKACEALGHKFGEWKPNGLGSVWHTCQYCGATVFDD